MSRSKRIKKPRYVKTTLALTDGQIALYAGVKVREALAEITQDMTLYSGVRLAEVMQAVYDQGQKDGRKEVIELLDVMKKGVNYLPPGRPRKSKKK